jgi:phosphomannomutase/phosphoglucomutase
MKNLISHQSQRQIPPALDMVVKQRSEAGDHCGPPKMGGSRPLTFGRDEMTRLKEIVLNADFKNKSGGSYQFHENFPAR